MIDGPECCSTVTPVARKRHRCCECRGEIRPGEKYERISGVWDGEPMRFKTCLDCVLLRTELSDKEGFQFEELWESVTESQDPGLISRFEKIRRKRVAIHADRAIVSYV